jgi:hypothetical protein
LLQIKLLNVLPKFKHLSYFLPIKFYKLKQKKYDK